MRAIRGYLTVARDLWLEWKVATQFSKPWDDVEEAMSAAYRLANQAPPPEAGDAPKTANARGSWRQMERVEVEPWFYFEIGRPGDVPSVFSTMATLEEDNLKRAIQFYSLTQAASPKSRKPRRKRKQNTDGTSGPA